MKKVIILLIFFTISLSQNSFAQRDSTTVIYQSLDIPEFEAISVVRYENFSSVFLRWDASDFVIDEVEIYEEGSMVKLILPNNMTAYSNSLQLDKNYTAIIKSNNEVINSKDFSTFEVNDNIVLSKDLYKTLTDAGRKENYMDALCEALLGANVHFEEKLSFYQKYYMDGRKLKQGNQSDFDTYIPNDTDTTNIRKTTCDFDFVYTPCKCKLVTKGTNLNAPGYAVGNWHTPYEDIRRIQNDNVVTFIDELRTGPAKHVALRQDHTRDHSSPFELTSGDLVRNARIQFFNLCDFGNGRESGVPIECQCSKEVDLSANYNTHMYVKSAAGGFLAWNSWARANVMDGAFLIEINESNAEAIKIGGSSAMIMDNCNSTLNTAWVSAYVDLVAAAVEAYFTGLIADAGGDEEEEGNNPQTEILENIAENLEDIAEDVKYILTNSPVLKSGTCGDQDATQTLLDVNNYSTTLSPNDELQFILFSTDISYIGGGGTWEVLSGISSDFHLAGVVTSGLDVVESSNPCCGDKFATYTCASVSANPTSNVQIDAPNNLLGVLNRVGQFYTPYQPWYEGFVDQNNNTGVLLPIADHNLIRGFDCEFKDPNTGSVVLVAPDINEFDSYQISTSLINLDLKDSQLDGGQEVKLYIFDTLGRLVYDTFGSVEPDKSMKINHSFDQGIYFIMLESDNGYYKSQLLIK